MQETLQTGQVSGGAVVEFQGICKGVDAGFRIGTICAGKRGGAEGGGGGVWDKAVQAEARLKEEGPWGLWRGRAI